MLLWLPAEFLHRVIFNLDFIDSSCVKYYTMVVILMVIETIVKDYVAAIDKV